MTRALERLLFGHRRIVLGVFAVATAVLAWFATGVRPDASFDKLMPSDHPYMETYRQTSRQFGGGNIFMVALEARHGTIFTPAYFEALKNLTDDIFFLPGIDRTHLSSIFTPDTRFIEIVEGGFHAGNVIPERFQPTPDGFAEVRDNIVKAGIVGRLVSADFRSAVVSARVNDTDPRTGEKLDYQKFAHEFDQKIRAKYDTSDTAVHVLGFAQAVGDITDGASAIVTYFAVALGIAAVLLWLVSRNVYLTVASLCCSVIAVVWQLGILGALGYGIDPISVLIPFLILAIGVSHGVQIALSNCRLSAEGRTPLECARVSFENLLEPGLTALLLAILTFLTVTTIPVPVIRELALTAAIGISVLAVTNLLCLPVIASFAPSLSASQCAAGIARQRGFDKFWRVLASLVSPRRAVMICAVTALLVAGARLIAGEPVTGDLTAGVAELRPDSRYNQDARYFTSHFSIGIDVLQVIAAGPPNTCLDQAAVERVDGLEEALTGVPGVRSAIALPHAMRFVNVAMNEGNPKWNLLPADKRVLARDGSGFGPSSGLTNDDCSLMPVLIFLTDHQAGTIARVLRAAKDYINTPSTADVKLLLAAGNAGVTGATNEVVASAQLPMLGMVYGVITLVCLAVFRSFRATLCVVLPLAAVSMLANAMMAALGIGLKMSTLPVLALGVGIGVDYGIYKFSRLRFYMRRGHSLDEAYIQTLRETGSAVIFTGLSLSLGVATWAFSPLQFQSDMGLLLTFMFAANMLGAIIVLPAIIGVMDLIAPQRQHGFVGSPVQSD